MSRAESAQVNVEVEARASRSPRTDVEGDGPRLQSMLSTAELGKRPSRPPDHAAENRALMAIAHEMAMSPDGVLQRLAQTALAVCRGHSAGISLLEESDQKTRFHWRAIAGQWASHEGGGTPRDFGPCGTVLDRNTALLCSHPERDFPYFGEVTPLLEEALLVPFYVGGEAVGTIWVIAHDTSRRFDAEDLRVLMSLATFAASAYQTVQSLEVARRALAAQKENEGQIAILGREAEHRAKNILAKVQAAVQLSQADSVDGLRQAIQGRIQALANIHRLFVGSQWKGAELRTLAAEELLPYGANGDTRVQIDGPTLFLERTTAQAIAVTFHELATNAAKYGALSVPGGRVRLEWTRAPDGRLVLRWTETGGPRINPPAQSGFGTRVMEAMIRSQLHGDLRFDWRASGLACEILIPESPERTK